MNNAERPPIASFACVACVALAILATVTGEPSDSPMTMLVGLLLFVAGGLATRDIVVWLMTFTGMRNSGH